MANLKSLSTNIISPSGRGSNAIAEIIGTSKLMFALEQLSAFQLDSFTNKFRPYTDALTIQNRDVNGALTNDTYSPADEVSTSMAIVGGKLSYDNVYQRDVANKVGGFNFEQDLKMKFKAWVKGLEAEVLAGSGAGTPKHVKGIATILDGTNIPGYSENRVINAKDYAKIANAKSFAMGSGNGYESAEALIQMLIAAKGSVENPNICVMHATMWATIQAIAFAKSIIGYSESNFGVMYETLFNIPVVTVASGLTLTEPDDTATTPLTNTGSIFFMSLGENNLSLPTQGFSWYDFDALENKEAGVEKWELPLNWRITNPKSITRVRNIKL